MKRSLLTALVLALAVAGWIVSGQVDGLSSGARATVPPAAASESAAAAAVTVRARVIEAQKRLSEIVARGRTEAVRMVDLRAETYGRVVDVEAAEGTRIKTGEVLVRIAVDDREARLVEAQALIHQRRLEHEAAQRLAEKGFRARTQAAAAAAALDAAKAQAASIETEIDHTVIRAPFDGVVEWRLAEVGAYLKVGDVVARVVDESPFLVVAHVAERDVGRLRRGMPARAELVTGEQLEGKLRYLATVADEATRTFRVEVEVANQARRLRAGVTAVVRIPTEETSVHLLSPALLTLDDQGVVGVRAVGADGIVEFHPTEIVADETAGVWLKGLPETVTVITVGQEYVREGDRVEVVLESDGPAS
jgi:multidrug efflux system membrane fusion protein